jgi:hypothetical protein
MFFIKKIEIFAVFEKSAVFEMFQIINILLLLCSFLYTLLFLRQELIEVLL